MTVPRISGGQQYRNKRGEVRTVVEVITHRSGPTARKRVVYRDESGVETSCRLDKFMRWRARGDAALVESEGV